MSVWRLEGRRSPMLPLLPLLIVISASLPMARHLKPVALWPTRMLDLQFSVQLLGPFAAGVAAWVASRDRRRGMTDLVATVPYPQWRRAMGAWLANTGWVTLFNLILAGLFITLTAVQATWGRPVLWPLVVAVTGMVMCSAVGYAIGSWLPGRFVAPLAATGLFGLFAAAVGAGDRGVRAAWLAPIYPAVGSGDGVFWPVRRDLSLVQLLFAAGILLVALGAAGLRGDARDGGGPGVTLRGGARVPYGATAAHRAAVAVTACGVAVTLLAGVLIGTAHVDQRGVVVPALHQASSDRPLPYPRVCAGHPMTVCLHPAYRRELTTVAAFFNRVASPVAGLPGIPTRLDQARSGGPASVSGNVITMPVGVVHEGVIPPLEGSIAAGTLVSTLVVGQPPGGAASRGGPGSGSGRKGATSAQRAVQWYLILAAGLPPDPKSEPADSAEQAAAARLAALDPAAQRTWLAAHFVTVRSGAPVPLEDFR